MIRSGAEQRTLRAAASDAHHARVEFDNARAWLAEALNGPMAPIAAEVWVFDDAFQHVVLVRHRWRGWVPPGGKIESGETPREAAHRELLEETGIEADLLEIPAAVSVRSYRSDWTPTLGLSYAAVVNSALPLAGEHSQLAAWMRLDQVWASAFSDDQPRIREYARWLSRTRASRPQRTDYRRPGRRPG